MGAMKLLIEGQVHRKGEDYICDVQRWQATILTSPEPTTAADVSSRDRAGRALPPTAQSRRLRAASRRELYQETDGRIVLRVLQLNYEQ
jgi:hypothetical protein